MLVRPHGCTVTVTFGVVYNDVEQIGECGGRQDPAGRLCVVLVAVPNDFREKAQAVGLHRIVGKLS